MCRTKYCHTKELSATINQRTVKRIEKPEVGVIIVKTPKHFFKGRLGVVISNAHVSIITLCDEEVEKVRVEKTKAREEKVGRLTSNIKRYLIGHLITKV